MTPKPPRNPEHCMDHSGLTALNRVNVGLGLFCGSLLTYSVFFQAGDIKLEVAREIARLDKADQASLNRIEDLEKWKGQMDKRISKLEAE